MSTVNIILYTLLVLVATSATAYAIYLRKKTLAVYKEMLELTIQKGILLQKLANALDALEAKPVEQTDGFLKFITESRDYAFQFIDTMQKSMDEFENSTKDIFEKQRLSEDVKTIKKAYQVLKEKTMPSDIPNN